MNINSNQTIINFLSLYSVPIGVVTVTAPHKLRNTTALNLNLSVSDGVHMVFSGLQVAVVACNHHTPR